jgi:hypothetical protein
MVSAEAEGTLFSRMSVRSVSEREGFILGGSAVRHA